MWKKVREIFLVSLFYILLMRFTKFITIDGKGLPLYFNLPVQCDHAFVRLSQFNQCIAICLTSGHFVAQFILWRRAHRNAANAQAYLKIIRKVKKKKNAMTSFQFLIFKIIISFFELS